MASFRIGNDTTLYALEVTENQTVRATFSGAVCCDPWSLSWEEEAVISYVQRLLTPEELACGALESTVVFHDNPFGRFLLFCQNDYGRITTPPIAFLIRRAEQ